MKKFIIFLILNTSFLILNSFAQSPNFLWAKGMGGTAEDDSRSTVIDAAGNIYTTGYFSGTVDFDPGAGIFNLNSVGGTDIFVFKLDAAGNFIWAKSIGGPSTSGDNGNSIAID